jgi:NAD(P)-dependent dehydrogenase (short-subunit alcohol dehydrogenase family)
LRGEYALATGSASNIGCAIALALAREGVRLIDIDAERNTSPAAEIEAAGGSAEAVSVDLSRTDGWRGALPVPAPAMFVPSAAQGGGCCACRLGRAFDVSNKIPLGRLGRAEDMAAMALALLSDRFCGYVTGATVAVDAGIGLYNWVPLPRPASLAATGWACASPGRCLRRAGLCCAGSGTAVAHGGCAARLAPL